VRHETAERRPSRATDPQVGEVMEVAVGAVIRRVDVPEGRPLDP
jgi:hypothetical protein